MQIELQRLRPGKYIANRDDGRRFTILRGKREWVIEAQDTLSVDGAPTLRVAVAGLCNLWTPQSREAA